MKKIINGKRYDTETAEHLAGDGWGGSGPSDFNYQEEDLYRKRTGEFFICGRGGPMTRYAVPVDQNGRTGGSDIRPLTEAEARQWTERHANDRYEAIFGPVDE